MSHDKRNRSGPRNVGPAGGRRPGRVAPGKRTLTARIPARAQSREERAIGSESTEDATRVPRDMVGPGYGSPIPPMEEGASPAEEAVAHEAEVGRTGQRPAARIQRRTRGAAQHPHAAADVVRRYDAFVDGIYAAARRIVLANIQAVEAWRNHVLNQLTPREMGAQVFGTGFGQLEEQAAASNARHLLAPYSAEANPVRQSLYEHQMAGQWRACTGCHVSNQAWALDARMGDARNPGTTPAQLLAGHAGLPVDRAASADARLFTDPAAWGTAFGPLLDPSPAAQPSPAAPVPAQAAGRPSHPLQTPVDPGRRQGESLAAARQAMRVIQPHLQPLGDRGYKIIPSNVISRFGQAPIEEFRAELAAAAGRGRRRGDARGARHRPGRRGHRSSQRNRHARVDVARATGERFDDAGRRLARGHGGSRSGRARDERSGTDRGRRTRRLHPAPG
jgi:hypothetical protein